MKQAGLLKARNVWPIVYRQNYYCSDAQRIKKFSSLFFS